MPTAVVLLHLHEDAQRDQLDAPIEDEASRIRAALTDAEVRTPKSLLHHRTEAIQAGDSLVRIDELAGLGGLPPTYARVPIDPFDLAIEVKVPDDEPAIKVINALDGLVGRLGSCVDASKSCALIGTEHTIFNGDGPLHLVYAFRAVGGVTHDDFLQYWRNSLVEHTTKTPGKTGYRQLHVDLGLSAQLARAVGVAIDDFDGVALEWYPTVADFMAAVDWASEPQAGIIESESNINDFKSSRALVAYGAN
jgi:hypothetical protein